jgi:hypothetical protein
MASRLRRDERSSQTGRVQMEWEVHGGSRFASGRIVDLSAAGVCVEMPDAVLERGLVTLRVPGLRLASRATVRYCRPTGLKYRIGLEFAGGYRWTQTPEMALAAL